MNHISPQMKETNKKTVVFALLHTDVMLEVTAEI